VTEVVYGLGAAQRDRLATARAEGRFFWLDASLSETAREDLIAVLDRDGDVREALAGSGERRPSRALRAGDASIGFALRCYVDADTVARPDAPRLRPVLVEVVVTGEYLLTVHEERVSLPAVLAPKLTPERGRRYAVYAVLDAMLATGSDGLDEIELTVDALAATWTDRDGVPIPGAMLREAGTRLSTMRRWATAEQTVVARLGVEIRALRGFADEAEPSFDRLRENVDRLLASIDAAANGMGMLLDLQLNQRAYLVSVVATIFVPLTFITGFFGMNFGWMVDHIDSPAAFLVLGFIVPGGTALLAWRLFVRRFLVGDASKPTRR
jgi:magnesium transporter